MSNINHILGLGNPGPEYEATRHNIGQYIVKAIVSHFSGSSFKKQQKLKADLSFTEVDSTRLLLSIPHTYMNESGFCTHLVQSYYKYTPSQLLVIHDDLDLSIGTIKYKFGGGDGGHNGIKDISQKLANKNYHRIKVGIGRGNNQVTSHVLGKIPEHEMLVIDRSIEIFLNILPDLLLEQYRQEAIKKLHTAT